MASKDFWSLLVVAKITQNDASRCLRKFRGIAIARLDQDILSNLLNYSTALIVWVINCCNRLPTTYYLSLITYYIHLTTYHSVE